MKIIRIVMVLVLVTTMSLFLSPQEAHADTKTWVGGTGVWSEGSNWSPTGVPASTDVIIIDDNGGTDSVVTLDINFTLEGSLLIEYGDTLVISAGVDLINDGTINNLGTIDNNGAIGNFSDIHNEGTINNECYIHTVDPIYYDVTIYNDGYIENHATINNDGTINNPGTIGNFDYGIIINDSGGTIVNAPGGIISNWSSSSDATIVNDTGGYIYNQNGADIVNAAGSSNALISNSGVIDNEGRIESEDTSVGSIVNDGTINNNSSGYLRIGTGVSNELVNDTNGIINNDGSIDNANQINNNGSIVNNSSGTIYNQWNINNDGTIDNHGTFNNYYTIDNFDGTINNYCGGIFNNQGTLLGNPVNYFLCGVTISDQTVNEGDGVATFTVSASSPGSFPATIDYSTADGTATAGNDYTADSGTLTFNPGETAKTISVPIIDDVIYEGPETFYLNLSNPVNAAISDDQGIGAIVDNDLLPELMVETLGDEVVAMEDLPASIRNSLTKSLDAAKKVLSDSNPKNDVAAINGIEAFINKIEAQHGKKIPEEVANELIAEAQDIIEVLSGGT